MHFLREDKLFYSGPGQWQVFPLPGWRPSKRSHRRGRPQRSRWSDCKLCFHDLKETVKFVILFIDWLGHRKMSSFY